MLNDPVFVFDERLHDLLQVMTHAGATHAAKGFSGMLGQTFEISQPAVRLVPLADVPYLLGGPESEAVGIYLRAQGEIAGQLMLVLAYSQALELAEVVLMEPPG